MATAEKNTVDSVRVAYFMGGDHASPTVHLWVYSKGDRIEVSGCGTNLDAAVLDAMSAAALRLDECGKPSIKGVQCERSNKGYCSEVVLERDGHRIARKYKAGRRDECGRLLSIAMAYGRALNCLP